jgi:MoxR-like ATPase
MMGHDLDRDVESAAQHINLVLTTVGKRMVGQKQVMERLLMGLIGQGHVLLEGLPGLAKTTAVKALSDCSDLTVTRIQFTPDLLPADVIGTQIYDPRQAEFKVKKGPIFTNLLIADEINRAPAKVQSALLEAMQERQVTLGDTTYVLPKPFLVMATQNPIEQEGTYTLPEAQMDRFLFKLKIDYNTIEEEIEVVHRMASGDDIQLEKVMQASDILRCQDLMKQIHVSDKIRRYIVELVFATRRPGQYGLKKLESMIKVGASPRASINLERASRLNALFQGRAYVTPQDVKDVGLDILRHRVLPTYEAEAENVAVEQMIADIFAHVDAP